MYRNSGLLSIKRNKKGGRVNKFADWMKANDKKQRGVAEKIGISTSTLHDILRKDQLPNLKVAYEIEKYTRGAITVYDWLDQDEKCDSSDPTKKSISKPNNSKK